MDAPSLLDHPEPPSPTIPLHSIPPSTQNSLNNSTTHHILHPTDPLTSETPSETLSVHTPHEPPTSPHSISLDQELLDLKKTLGGVSASLGGWWGKVQKQSADVLTASNITAQINHARKDLASLNLIEKAKKEVERLGDHAKEGYSAISSEIEKGPEPDSIQGRIVNVDGLELTPPSRAISSSSIASTITVTENEASTSSKGKERAPDEPPALPTNPFSVFDSTRLGSFFSKITNDGDSVTASLQSKIPQLPGSTSFDLTEIQKRAESYLAKGEVYFQDVSKELKEFVQEAVKVIPPSEEDETPHNSDPSGNLNSLSNSGLTEKRRMLDIKRESMISQLRRDKTQLVVDPRSTDVNVQNAFDDFILALQQAGGLEGEAWKKRIDSELQLEEPDGSAIKELLDNLVPSSMTSETFWTRYFFRINQIDQEEAARRLVLSAAQEDHEGEFSWDIEDESEPPSPAVFVKSIRSSGGTELTGKEDQAHTPKPSDLSSSMTVPTLTDNDDQVHSHEQPLREDEWGNSPVNKPFPSMDAKTGITKEGGASNTQVSRRNSFSEPDTSDGFDVVSAQQSSDEKPDKPNDTQSSDRSHKDNHDAEDDSDWE